MTQYLTRMSILIMVSVALSVSVVAQDKKPVPADDSSTYKVVGKKQEPKQEPKNAAKAEPVGFKQYVLGSPVSLVDNEFFTKASVSLDGKCETFYKTSAKRSENTIMNVQIQYLTLTYYQGSLINIKVFIDEQKTQELIDSFLVKYPNMKLIPVDGSDKILQDYGYYIRVLEDAKSQAKITITSNYIKTTDFRKEKLDDSYVLLTTKPGWKFNELFVEFSSAHGSKVLQYYKNISSVSEENTKKKEAQKNAQDL